MSDSAANGEDPFGLKEAMDGKKGPQDDEDGKTKVENTNMLSFYNARIRNTVFGNAIGFFVNILIYIGRIFGRRNEDYEKFENIGLEGAITTLGVFNGLLLTIPTAAMGAIKYDDWDTLNQNAKNCSTKWLLATMPLNSTNNSTLIGNSDSLESLVTSANRNFGRSCYECVLNSLAAGVVVSAFFLFRPVKDTGNKQWSLGGGNLILISLIVLTVQALVCSARIAQIYYLYFSGYPENFCNDILHRFSSASLHDSPVILLFILPYSLGLISVIF
jgi:hypothetical protein